MNTADASREILWNVNSLLDITAMYLLFAVSLAIGFSAVCRRAELWSGGRPDPEHLGKWRYRFIDLFSWSLLQRGTVREKAPALAHTLVYIGFVVLLFTTTMVMIDYDLGWRIYRGEFYLAVTVLSDLFGAGVIFGCGIFAYRRYVLQADLLHNRAADWSALAVLALLIVQGFVLEGLRIHVTGDPWARYSPVGLLVSKFFWPLTKAGGALLHYLMWWFHTITVFAAVALLPYTKFFHIISSSANLYFRHRDRPRGALSWEGDIEKLMETNEDFSIGLGTIRDYTWKQLLDLDACTSCGRCQENCPAYLSEKVLSPKYVILDTRNHALALHADDKIGESKIPTSVRAIDGGLIRNFFLPSQGADKQPGSGGYTSRGAFRAANRRVQESARVLGGKADALIAGDVMDPDVFWSCTTCGACVEVCPVGINHVDQILGNRRNMVLMRGEIPAEAQSMLRSLENRGNPYGPADQRNKWADDLGLPLLKSGDEVDYLYWVGCISSFDPRKQKIARALVTIMRRAGLSFGVLGNAEGCTGDPARRLGEEALFQAQAKQNLEVLRSVRFRYIVANCPHCFNTLLNEYPALGNLADGAKPKIIHHSVLLQRLLDEKRITLSEQPDDIWTFHDPCYLGRYNGVYEEPRAVLKKAGLRIVEMDRSREKGMCCGAGGGHFWMDMKAGQRINALRTDQAAQTGTTKVATACPFCMHMMEDGAKITNRAMEVKDIAEVMLERLV